MARAINSFPVPVSPDSRTVESLGATVSTSSRTCFSAGLFPTMFSKLKSLRISSSRYIFSWASLSLSSEICRYANAFSMAMAIWPEARLRKSTSPGENGKSVVRKIDRIPSARPRFTSGIFAKGFYALRSRYVRCLRRELVRFPRVNDHWFQGVKRFLNGRTWRNQQLFLADPLSMRKIHGQYPEFLRSGIGQYNCYRVSAYDLAYVRRNRAQDLTPVEARRDTGRQIEEQLQALVLIS